MNLHDIPGRVLDHILAFDDVRVLQAYLAARLETEVLRRRHLHEIIAFDPDFPGEWNFPGASIFVSRIVNRMTGDPRVLPAHW
jgi:hypothetical protein